MEDRINEIKKFWDARAEKYRTDWKATLGERYLRLLEIKTMTKLIKRYKPLRVLDIGCGNGYSTKMYANRFPFIQFIGVDYSDKMIKNAKKMPLPNCEFFVGDVLKKHSLPDGEFDLIITQRCLQNLVDYESQQNAINNLKNKKSQHGVLILMECSKDGVKQLNTLRSKLGRKPLENIEPWHNNFFVDQNLINDFGSEITHFSSTYMLITKLITQRLSFLAYILPALGKFGYDKIYLIK
jgi:ubiquinone/menaquinone biosynthesis C-methylase UbiE